MLTEAGVPELERHDTPSELLQPLVPQYEEALSQLERAVKVRPWRFWEHSGCWQQDSDGDSPGPSASWLRAGDPGPGVEVQGRGGSRAGHTRGGLSCFLSPQEERRQKAA